MKHHVSTVTQEGMTVSQPGMCVSVSSGGGAHILRVSRHYPELPNEFGGRGRFKKCDADGLGFASTEEAFAYALDKGYTQRYYTSPDLRARRVRAARNPKAIK